MKDPRESMIESFIAAVDDGVELLVAVSDSTSTSKIAPFATKYPDRVVNVGIAEQNLVGMAAGLALGGYVVATANAAPFLVNRSAEQVRNDVAYTDTNVKMMGLNPGFAYGSLGPTHHSLEDLSMMRSLGGMRIYTPVDPAGTAEVVARVLRDKGPAYIRIDSGKYPDLEKSAANAGLDRPIPLSSGGDLTLLGLGTSAHAVAEASEILAREGIQADAWAIPALRPLETDCILESAAASGRIVTVEAHSTHGGLGSLTAELLADNRVPAILKRLGIPEGRFAPASPRDAIEEEFLLDAPGIASTARQILEV